MMSYAVNTTFREEELYDYSYSNQNEDYQASVITWVDLIFFADNLYKIRVSKLLFFLLAPLRVDLLLFIIKNTTC